MSDVEVLEIGSEDNIVSASLEMSDEDYMKQGQGVTVDAIQEEVQTETQEEVNEEVSAEQDSGTDNSSDSGDITPVVDNSNSDIGSDTSTGSELPDEKSAEIAAEPDYKDFYTQLTAPFKANGKEMKVDNVDDAIRLMQMGANYNRKMAGLRPHMKILKTLEKNGLMDETKLDFLIDLDKKNPEAIAKLVSEAGIDPIGMDLDNVKSYKAPTHVVDDQELALDTVLSDIQDTDTYGQTLEIVGSKWDNASKKIVRDAPELLKVLNDHVGNGIYTIISTEVDRARAMGRLIGLSDIAAYQQVGDAIDAKGGFAHLFPQKLTTTPAPVVSTPKPKAVEELKDKRRAAGTTKTAVTAAKQTFNPLSMSDEEFMRQSSGKY